MCCFKVMERRWGLTLSFLEKRIDSPTCSRLSGQTASHLLQRMIFFLPLQLCNYAANFLSVFFPSMMRQILILALIRKACVCLFSYFFGFSLRPRRNVCLLDCGTHRSERLCFMWSCRPLRKRSIVFVRRVSATPSEENKGPPNFKRGALAPLLSSARPRVQQRCNSFNIGQESLITITVVGRLQINEETSSVCCWVSLDRRQFKFLTMLRFCYAVKAQLCDITKGSLASRTNSIGLTIRRRGDPGQLPSSAFLPFFFVCFVFSSPPVMKSLSSERLQCHWCRCRRRGL